MPVGQPLLNTKYKHSNSSVNMKIDKRITMTMVITIAVIMRWRENHTKSATYKLQSQ